MSRKIVIVGYCASGKSTIAGELERRGYNVHVVGQEHSIVADLWQRPKPDLVVFLDVDLETIRQRRDDPSWPEWLFEIQGTRLENARDHADVVVDTSELDAQEVLNRVLGAMAPD